jgi:hypothetical protein
MKFDWKPAIWCSYENTGSSHAPQLAKKVCLVFSAANKQIVDGKAQFRSLAEPWADPAPAPGG